MMVVIVVVFLVGEATRAAKDGLRGSGDGIGSMFVSEIST
jgi:hypothetical protein